MKRVDIMFPVYCGNLHEIEPCVDAIIPAFTRSMAEYDWRIIFAVNGKDPEAVITLVKKIHETHANVWYDYAQRPGKGSGIIHSWSASPADIIAYMDVDLSTDIDNFPDLVRGVESGYDLCIGSRYHPGSNVQRSLKRKIVSIGYHKLFMKIVLGARTYTDAQCGFKAVSPRVVKEILPLVRNRDWFFESEMLYVAQRKKFPIREFPVKWSESPFSGLTLYKAIWEFIRAGFRMRFTKF